MMVTEITLRIKTEREEENPANWDWAVLLDLPDRKNVEVVSAQVVSK